MSATNIRTLDQADVLRQAHLRRLERYCPSSNLMRLLAAAHNGAEFRRRGGLPMVFEGEEYGTEEWLKRWLINTTSEATGRILLDVIESDESEKAISVLIAVLSVGCIAIYL